MDRFPGIFSFASGIIRTGWYTAARSTVPLRIGTGVHVRVVFYPLVLVFVSSYRYPREEYWRVRE